MPGKARERGKWEGGDRKGEASSWFGQFAAGRGPFLPEGGTRRKQKVWSAPPARVSQLMGRRGSARVVGADPGPRRLPVPSMLWAA